MTSLGVASIQVTLDQSQLDAALGKLPQKLGQAGQSAEKTATQAFGQAGQAAGEAFTRGADGKLRDSKGRFIKGGESAAQGFSDGLKKMPDPSPHFGAQGSKSGNAFMGGLNKALSNVSQITQPLKNIGRTIGDHLRASTASIGQGIGMSIGQTITSGIGAGLGKLTDLKNLGEFDAAARQVRTLTDDFKGMQKGAFELAKELKNGVTATEILKGGYEVLSSGISDTAEVLDIMRASSKAAIAGQTDVATISDALTSVINAYKSMGMSGKDAMKVTNQMSGVIDAGKIKYEEYATQIGKLAPVAALAGIKFEEINAAIAKATVGGLRAESAFAGIRQAVSNILTPTKEAQEMAEQLGIAFDANALKTKGFIGIMGELTRVGATAEQISKLFGSVEAVAAVAPLVGKTNFAELQGIQGKITGASVEKNYQIVSEGVVQKQKQLMNQLIDLDVKLKSGFAGEVLTKALSGLSLGLNQVVGAVENLNKIYQSLSPEQQKLIQTIGGGLVIITGAATGFVALVAAVSLVGGAVTTAIGAIGSLMGLLGTFALATAPVLVPIAALAAAVYAVAKAFEATDTQAFVAALSAAGIAIAAVFGPAILSAIATGVTALVTGFASIAVAATAAIVPLLPWIAAAAGVAAALYGLYKVFDANREYFDPWIAKFGEIWQSAKLAVQDFWNKSVGILADWGKTLAQIGASMGSELLKWAQWWGNLGLSLARLTANILLAIGSGIAKLVLIVAQGLGNVISTITQWGAIAGNIFKQIWDALVGVAIGASTRIYNAVSRMVSGILAGIADWLAGITGFSNKYGLQATAIGRTTSWLVDKFVGFKNSVVDGFKMAIEWCKSFGSAIGAWMDWAGKKVGEFLNGFKAIPDWINKASDAIGKVLPGGGIQSSNGGTTGSGFKVASPIAGTSIDQAISYRGLPVQRPEAGRPGGRIHKAIDYGSGIGATLGTPVTAIASGTAKYTPNVGYYGKYKTNMVDLNFTDANGKKVLARYFHLGSDSAKYFKDGYIREVKAGDVLGVIGADGKIGGNEYHLDLKIFVNGQQVYDPRKYLAELRRQATASSKASAGTGSGEVMMSTSVYTPGGGGMEGKKKDARGRRLLPTDRAIAIPAMASTYRKQNQIPYGSVVELSYNGKKVRAKVVDAGPFIPGRQMDITKGAADAIGFPGLGQVGVKLVELPKGADPNKNYYFGEATYRPRFPKNGEISESEAQKAVESVVEGTKSIRLQTRASASGMIGDGLGVLVASTDLSGLGLNFLSSQNKEKQYQEDIEKAKRSLNKAKEQLDRAIALPKILTTSKNNVEKLQQLLRRTQFTKDEATRDAERFKKQIDELESRPRKGKATLERIDNLKAQYRKAENRATTADEKIQEIQSKIQTGDTTKETGRDRKIREAREKYVDAQTRLNRLIRKRQEDELKVKDKAEKEKKRKEKERLKKIEEQDNKQIEILRMQYDTIDKKTQEQISAIERDIATGKISEESGESKKAQLLMAAAKLMEPLAAKARNAIKSTKLEDNKNRLRDLIILINGKISEAASRNKQKQEEPIKNLRQEYESIDIKAQEQISAIERDIATGKITKDVGESQKTGVLTSAAKLMEPLAAKANALIKTTKSEDTKNRFRDLIISINGKIAEAASRSKQKQEEPIKLIKQDIDRIIDASNLKLAEVDRSLADNRISETESQFQKAQILADRSQKLDAIKPKIQQLQKTSTDTEFQSSIASMLSEIASSGTSAANAQAKLNQIPIANFENEINAIIEQVNTKNLGADYAVSLGQIKPAAAEIMKALNLSQASSQLASYLPLLEEFKVKLTDPDAIAKVDKLTASIQQQAIVAVEANKRIQQAELSKQKNQYESILKASTKQEEEVKQREFEGTIRSREAQQEILKIKQKTTEELTKLLPLVTDLRDIQTDPAAIESLNEIIAGVRTYKNETILAQREIDAAYQITKSIAEGITETTRNWFTGLFQNGLNLSNFLDNLLSKIADVALSGIWDRIIGDSVSGFIGGIFGFNRGGKVPNYANGGAIGSISDALRREGSNSVLAALTPGEQVLNLRDAPIYRQMVADGTWDKMQRVYRYAQGGMVGGVPARFGVMRQGSTISPIASQSQKITIDRINQVDYVSVDQLRGILDIEIPMAAKAGAALVEQNLGKTSWRNQYGLR